MATEPKRTRSPRTIYQDLQDRNSTNFSSSDSTFAADADDELTTQSGSWPVSASGHKRMSINRQQMVAIRDTVPRPYRRRQRLQMEFCFRDKIRVLSCSTFSSFKALPGRVPPDLCGAFFLIYAAFSCFSSHASAVWRRMTPYPMNVRFGSKADLFHACPKGPLSGVKRTYFRVCLNVR